MQVWHLVVACSDQITHMAACREVIFWTCLRRLVLLLLSRILCRIPVKPDTVWRLASIEDRSPQLNTHSKTKHLAIEDQYRRMPCLLSIGNPCLSFVTVTEKSDGGLSIRITSFATPSRMGRSMTSREVWEPKISAKIQGRSFQNSARVGRALHAMHSFVDYVVDVDDNGAS